LYIEYDHAILFVLDMNTAEAKLLEAGLGNVTWWGYSPAFDLLGQEPHSVDALKHVLLVGAGDGRHFIESLADTKQRNVSFW
jgi:hypothetical protein